MFELFQRVSKSTGVDFEEVRDAWEEFSEEYGVTTTLMSENDLEYRFSNFVIDKQVYQIPEVQEIFDKREFSHQLFKSYK